MTAAKKATADQVREISLEQLVTSPEETRRTIDQNALEELARSIAKHGVIEALLVRVAPGKGLEGSDAPYEIVAGQRRWLASKLAGLETCPCVVRKMTDDEARALRIISNLQRENLAPMEEALAYGKLLELPGATIETVAAALAKTPSYVGRRAQLLKAIEPVREALKAGAIEVGHALELARLDEAMQHKMLTRMQCGASLVEPDDIEDENGESGTCRFRGCSEDDACEGGCSWANEEQTVCDNPKCLAQFREETGQVNDQWRKTHYSVVELRREIASSSFCELKTAPFPLEADLPPIPCTECPKRAGNSQLLFDDCAQDTCTDRPCFNRKVNAWIEAELATAKAETRKLLKLTENWNSDKDVVQCGEWGSSARVFLRPAECSHSEEGIWIDGHNAGKRVMVCRAADCKTHHGSSGRGSSSSRRFETSPKQKATQTAFLARVKAEKGYRAALFDVIGAVNPLHLAKAGGDVHRRLAARVVDHVLGHSDSTRYQDLARATKINGDYFGWAKREQLGKHLESLRIEQQLLFAAMAIEDSQLCVHEHDVPGGLNARDKQKKLGLEELAEVVGVDWKSLRRKHAEPKAKPQAKPSVKIPVKKQAKKPAKKAGRK